MTQIPDWADQTGFDLASSSDEEFVSTEPTQIEASMEPDITFRSNLSSALGKLSLQESSSGSSVRSASRTSTPATRASILTRPSLSIAKTPMQLLDLPLDVLRDIIKEVTHATDLTSLALTCSTLHGLAVPHMYSRFDIVWPESLNPTDDYSGVDALSYGLSTLVMGEDVFHQMPITRDDQSANACSNCGCTGQGNNKATQKKQTSTGFSSRRGNHYAQYTRTFSIGNGPLIWVQEYSVNREIGKMLGTLVALAVARMDNLEAFIWDMPTGVVREIWLALGSLADRLNHECRLDRVWVRWHDNSENQARISTVTTTGSRLRNYQHVEHPSLSVLPPLRNVAVLDIDEKAYVEEMAVLIERSRHRLVELRIGIAQKAHLSPWILCAKDNDASSDSLFDWPRIGGILSILTKRDVPASDDTPTASSNPNLSTQPDDMLGNSLTGDPFAKKRKHVNLNNTDSARDDTSPPKTKVSSPQPVYRFQPNNDKLNLQVFELERVPLSVSSLLPTLDWTRLTTLTLMQCEDHEQLWRALRRKYAPPPTLPKRLQNGDHSHANYSGHDYSLNIKHLRTDTVSPYLMLFIKDALAPNTLESVFLHEAMPYESTVQIEAIYRHIIRKHRLSLRRILIDASNRRDNPLSIDRHWHKWMLNHEMIAFVTSGRMPQLKEIGMAMHYRDWHYFLQRLPNMSQLRALYLPHIRESVHRDLKELALQVLDIVSIRAELKIAYVGLEKKCYQILEGSSHESDPDFEDATNDEHSSDPDDDDNDDDLSDFGNGSIHDDDTPEQNQELLSSDISDDDDEPDELCSSRTQFKLQEIPFDDDKISIFKARHGVI
ncbi:hypothetical protein N7495_001551 [Penicillium taxi]|uniref:uncharacterized protein n=1 Tax=Penicillium taxi TaxID=168475 RepID=UPI0025455513|nr:uncharacterized protein N7495_001551 [Penicillium taxi]KAJ5908869.1 hypothetical protein N7495_001551 [Penicillium taxi]